jgi:hypothetical protein
MGLVVVVVASDGWVGALDNITAPGAVVVVLDRGHGISHDSAFLLIKGAPPL